MLLFFFLLVPWKSGATMVLRNLTKFHSYALIAITISFAWIFFNDITRTSKLIIVSNMLFKSKENLIQPKMDFSRQIGFDILEILFKMSTFISIFQKSENNLNHLLFMSCWAKNSNYWIFSTFGQFFPSQVSHF